MGIINAHKFLTKMNIITEHNTRSALKIKTKKLLRKLQKQEWVSAWIHEFHIFISYHQLSFLFSQEHFKQFKSEKLLAKYAF